MKKTLLFLTFLLGIALHSWAYDFYAVAPSGQTLYYNIVDGNAEVTPQNTSSPFYTTYPTGDLTIPSTVTYNGTSYSVTTIGSCAFGNCSGLTSVTIPNSVTFIRDYAFSGCTGLTSVYYTGDVAGWCGIIIHEDFGLGYTNPLYYAKNLYINYSLVTDLVISNTVDSIRDYTFINCSSLTSVTIPNSVTSIGNNAFYGCTGLTGALNIPSSVTSIGYSAFSGCSGISEIHSLAYVAPTLGSSTFNGVTNTIPVYIPCGASASYYSRWSYFSNFIEGSAFTFSAVSADNNMGAVQILTMPTCTNPQAVIYASANSGYRFDHWSDGNTANPRVLTVTEDTELIGYFVPDGGGSQGIDDITSADGMKVYTRGNTIVIDFSGQQAAGSRQSIVVCDVMGRVVKQAAGSDQQAAVEIPVTSAGVYMVKVGERPLQKVVVR